MIRYFFLLTFVLLFSNASFLLAQSVEITKFDLEEFGDDVQTVQQFAEDGNGDIWYLFSYIDFGNTFVIVRYVDEQWELVEFPDCNTCQRDIKSDAQGRIWVATTEGVYRWNGVSWSKVLDDAALKISFDSQDNMALVNSDGLFFYDGNTVSPASTNNGPDQISVVNELLYDQEDLLWLLFPSLLFNYSATDGWKRPPQASSTLQIEVGAENFLYYGDNIGLIGYIDDNTLVSNVFPNVFPSGVSFMDFTLDPSNNVWVGVQGTAPGLRYYDGTNTLSIPVADLVDDGILTNHQFMATDGSLWVASRSSTTIARVRVMTPNNTKEATTPLEFKLAPNPSDGKVQLSFDDVQGVAQIILFDAYGRMIRQWEQGPGTIDLSDLAAGVYWIQLRQEKGLGLQKIIVQP